MLPNNSLRWRHVVPGTQERNPMANATAGWHECSIAIDEAIRGRRQAVVRFRSIGTLQMWTARACDRRGRPAPRDAQRRTP